MQRTIPRGERRRGNSCGGRRHGWWHGIQFGNLAFFDGSVRRTAMGDVTTKEYSFYMDETRHVGLDEWNQPSYRMIRRQ